jgi:hypothetical protein
LPIWVKIVEYLGGVYGHRPTMIAEISSEMRQLVVQKKNHRNQQQLEEFQRHRMHGGGKEAAAWTMYPGPWDLNNPSQMWARVKKEWTIEWTVDAIRENLYQSPDIEHMRSFAIEAGFTQSELDNFIVWKVRRISILERERLANLFRVTARLQKDKQLKAMQEYAAVMIKDYMEAEFGEKYTDLPVETLEPFIRKITRRVDWQIKEMLNFVMICLKLITNALADDPITLPTSDYEGAHKRERTQADIITEMAQELMNLPRFTAYAKMLKENNTTQTVEKHKLTTVPMPDEKGNDALVAARWRGRSYGQTREDIEQEIQKRQVWRKGNSPKAPKLPYVPPKQDDPEPLDSPPPFFS